jgi:hypothetical protein
MEAWIQSIERMMWHVVKSLQGKYGISITVDDDLKQEVITHCWAVNNRIDISRSIATNNSYMFKVIQSTVIDWGKKNGYYLSLDELVEMYGDEVLDIQETPTFGMLDEVLLMLEEWKGKVGDDLINLLTGNVDIPNVIRSVKCGKKIGLEWIESWLKRGLTQVEKRLCFDIWSMIRDFEGGKTFQYYAL